MMWRYKHLQIVFLLYSLSDLEGVVTLLAMFLNQEPNLYSQAMLPRPSIPILAQEARCIADKEFRVADMDDRVNRVVTAANQEALWAAILVDGVWKIAQLTNESWRVPINRCLCLKGSSHCQNVLPNRVLLIPVPNAEEDSPSPTGKDHSHLSDVMGLTCKGVLAHMIYQQLQIVVVD